MKSKRKRVWLAVVGAAVLLAAGVFGVWQYKRATWRYPYSPDTLTLYISGDRESGVAKPHQNDDLVLFLIYYPDYEIYQLAEREAAMFAVMPGNTLYAFYTHPSFVEYDNRPVNDLYTSILEAAINIRGNPDEYEDTFAPGDILNGLLDPQSDILSPLESIVESAS